MQRDFEFAMEFLRMIDANATTPAFPEAYSLCRDPEGYDDGCIRDAVFLEDSFSGHAAIIQHFVGYVNNKVSDAIQRYVGHYLQP